MVGVNSMIQSLELPNSQIIIRRTVGCVVSAMMSRVYHNSSGNNNHLSWFLWLVQALGPQGLQKMGLCFMTLEKLPAEKLCARFYCHSTYFCTDHRWTKLARPTKSFTFSSGLKLHQFSKLPMAKLMVLFYSIFLIVSKLYCGKNCPPCNPATSVQFCNDIFIATDQMPYLWTIELFSCKGRLAYIIAIIICWINHYCGLCI